MNAAGILNVNVDGREVAITCIHVGVNLPRVQQALNAPQFEIEVNKWRQRFQNKTIVGGLCTHQISVPFSLSYTSVSIFMYSHICFHILIFM